MRHLLITSLVALCVTQPIAAASPEHPGRPGKPNPTPPVPAGKHLFESPQVPKADSPIDKFVFTKLRSLGIQPALCSDSVFLRRAYLDVIGTMPTPKEASHFIQDPSPDKRRKLIDALLERPEFATYWAMKWGDILRIKAEFPINLWPNAAQAYHRWVLASIRDNKPYDQFARELLTSSGSNFRVGPVNFYRAMQNKTPEGITRSVALNLMGTRTDDWPKEKLDGMAVFFSQVGYKPSREWKEEIVFWDPLNANAWAAKAAAEAATAKPKAPPIPPANQKNAKKKGKKGKPVVAKPDQLRTKPPKTVPTNLPTRLTTHKAVFPDGKSVTLSPDIDPREVFADWLITPENPYFSKAIANRVWGWLLGRGVIHQADDIRPDNPPSNPELLAWLEKELITHQYDLKHLYRVILNSNTYQLSPLPKSKAPKAQVAAANFASYPLRRLDAEVLIDAINTVTGTHDLYTSPIPEPFTYIPKNMPAIAVADGSITSSFLALFGRSARATGMCNERNNKHQPSQWLHTLNSSHIQNKIAKGPRIEALVKAKRPVEKTLEELYLTILSRFPTPAEIETHKAYGAKPTWKSRTEWHDIVWSLMNSSEFLYRH